MKEIAACERVSARVPFRWGDSKGRARDHFPLTPLHSIGYHGRSSLGASQFLTTETQRYRETQPLGKPVSLGCL